METYYYKRCEGRHASTPFHIDEYEELEVGKRDDGWWFVNSAWDARQLGKAYKAKGHAVAAVEKMADMVISVRR